MQATQRTSDLCLGGMVVAISEYQFLPVVFIDILSRWSNSRPEGDGCLTMAHKLLLLACYLSWLQEHSARSHAIQNCACCCSLATRKVLQGMEEVDAARLQCRNARESLWHARSAACPCSFVTRQYISMVCSLG